MRWHFLQTPPADGAHNMALDEALMRRAGRSGQAVFRVYGWSVPTLSLGRNQRSRDCYDEDAANRLGVAFVRRPTGGRALLHHREVTYSATLPVEDAGAAGAAYAFINAVLLRALGAMGVPAALPTHPASIPPGLRPCFDVPAEHEIAVDNRKLVGSAQWRSQGTLLQHGSILVRDDQPLIGQLLRSQVAHTPRAATLSDALGYDPSADDVARQILQSLEEATESPAVPLVVDDRLRSDAERLCETYRDPSWTWRR